MPWRRYTFRDWSAGLVVSPPSDDLPPQALRRAKNVHVLQGRGSVRSRSGSQRRVVAGGFHSPVRYRGERFYGLNNGLVRDSSPSVFTITTGFDGGKLCYAKAPPFIGLEDYLFVANEGKQIKIAPDFSTSKWGIDPPTSKPNLSLGDENATLIDSFDSAVGSRSAVFTPAGAAALAFGTPNQEGSAALQIPFDTANQKCVINYNFATPQDFTVNNGRTSPDEDLIALWVQTNRPETVVAFQLRFMSDDQNYYQYDFLTSRFNAKTRNEAFTAQYYPADPTKRYAPTLGDRKAFDLYKSQGHWPPEQFRNGQNASIFETQRIETEVFEEQFPLSADTWVRLLVPKHLFFTTGSPSWTNITKYQIYARINRRGTGSPDTTVIYVDGMKLVGRVGISGDYRYAFTFLNSTTGHRSNPLFIDRDGDGIVDDIDYASITGAVRQSIHVENIPVSLDPQVDKVEAWRTFGNGVAFFKAWEVANGTLTYDDDVADSTNSDSRADADVLNIEELEITNTPPSSKTHWVVWHQGRAWTLETTPGFRGRLNFSPQGRPEAVKDFLEITNDADPLTGAVSWNGSLYVFSESKVWQVTGTDIVVARQIAGAPGTLHPYTIAVTPNGIIYFATDGVRVFDGNASALVAHDAVSLPFRGTDTDVIAAFVGDTACFGRNEYWVSDGTRILALDLIQGTWREIDFAATGLAYEEDVDDFVVTEGVDGNGVFLVDVPGLTSDGGFDLDFDMESATLRLSPDVRGVVRRVHIDLNTGGEEITATLIADDAVVATWILNTAARETVSYETLTNGKRIAIRLQGALTTAAVEIFGIELDVYHPDQDAA